MGGSSEVSGYSEKKARQEAEEFDASLPGTIIADEAGPIFPERSEAAGPSFRSIQEEIERVSGEIKRRFPDLPIPDGRSNEVELALSSILRRLRQLGVQVELRVPEGRDKSLAMTALEDVYLRSYRAFF